MLNSWILSSPPACRHCPAGTEPVVGFEYKWWNTLPMNMETTVLSGTNFEYKGMTGKGISVHCTLPAPCTPNGGSSCITFSPSRCLEKSELIRPHIPWTVPLLMGIYSTKSCFIEAETELETACTRPKGLALRASESLAKVMGQVSHGLCWTLVPECHLGAHLPCSRPSGALTPCSPFQAGRWPVITFTQLLEPQTMTS